MLTIENLSKWYGSKKVLNDVNISFKPGHVSGIVGANGAGKTTLFKCIAGLEQYQGRIDSKFDNLKNHLGFLPTNPYFFPKITGREYMQLLSIARNIKNQDFNQKNIFDLPLDQYAVNYSTGMKKKLALTAVLSQQNACFILDEPFNGVDIQSNIIITEIIHRLKTLGKTIVISSHIFSTLKNTCDEIHLLQDGHFVKKVSKDQFDQLEQEMINFTVGDSLDKLDLK